MAPIRRFPDTDGDGLTDGEEVLVHLTDPLLADTDGGGIPDGQEVLDGTDPLDPADDVVPISLPVTLTDGEGFDWDIQRDGAILNGSANAFDDAYKLLIDGALFPDRFVHTAENLGREIDVGTWNSNFLGTSRKVFVPDDEGFARILETFENYGPVDKFVVVEIDTDLGSNLETVVVTTSSGDAVFDLDDLYIVTDDGEGAGSPAVSHVFAGPQPGLLPPVAVSTTAPGNDDVSITYQLFIPAGETVSLMHFAAQRNDRASAGAIADQLLAAGAGFDGLSTAELSRIVNFFPFADADLDGLSRRRRSPRRHRPHRPGQRRRRPARRCRGACRPRSDRDR